MALLGALKAKAGDLPPSSSLDGFVKPGRRVLTDRGDGPGWLPNGGMLAVEGADGNWLTQRFTAVVDPRYGGERRGRMLADGKWQWFPWRPLSSARYAGKRVAVMGDSIVADGGNATSIASHLAEIMCAEVLNCGFGGTGWGPIKEGGYHEQFDAMCIYHLADCFVSGTALAPRQAAEDLAGSARWDFRWAAEQFAKAVDNPPDAMLIMAGTNDFGRSLPLDAFERSVRSSLTKMIGALPMTDMIVTTPIYRQAIPANKLGLTLAPYANVLRIVCEEYRLKVINLATESGVNEFTAPTRLVDGTHPTPAYREALAHQIAVAL